MEQRHDGFLPSIAAGTFGHDDEQITSQARLLFEQLYAANVGRVQMLARRYLRNQELAEDVVQETFLRVFKGIGTFDARRPAWPWISAIARHVCVDLVRRRALRPECACEDADTWSESTLSQTAPSPEDELFVSERRRAISDALGSIVGRYRRALLLRDVEGWCYEDIANLEGLTIPAVKSLILRARRKFRACWEEMAEERGLSGALVLPLLGRARRLRRGASRAVLRARAASGSMEIIPAGFAQHVSGIAALALALAITAPSSSYAPARAAVPSAPVRPPAVAELAASVRPEAASTAPRPGSQASQDRVAATMGALGAKQAVRQPEEARITSIAFSPRFAQDHTIFLMGHALTCADLCPGVLFASRDAGTSWTRLDAIGSLASRLLLPPNYGAGDDRLFAAGAGLEVSADGGRTFQPLVAGSPLAVGPAAISPRFHETDARIVVGGRILADYLDDFQAIAPHPSTSVPGPFELAFSPSGDVLWLGGIRPSPESTWTGAVFRCSGAVCEERQLAGIVQPPKVRVGDATVYAFGGPALYASLDEGISFGRLALPGPGDVTDVRPASAGLPMLAAMWDPRGTGGVWMRTSPDGWTAVDSGGLRSGVIALEGSGPRVVAALASGGVSCSADGGRTWSSRCAS